MTWWRRLLSRRRLEDQLDKELRFHLEQHAEDFIQRGYCPGEAERQARLILGGPEQVKENCRDARRTRWLEDFWQDLRYAFRTLRQRPGFAAVALLTLALGAGATTVMFTLIDGVLLKPLPYPQPERLVTLQEKTDWSTPYGNLWAFSYPNFLDVRRSVRSIDIAAWRYAGGTVYRPEKAEYVDAFEVSSTLFSVLGIEPLQGRAFRPEVDRAGGDAEVILSYSLWQRLFAGNPSALGMSLVFEGKPYTVIGVMPSRLRFGGDEPDLLIPLGQNTEAVMHNREAHIGIQVVGRLRPGFSLAQAQSELSLLGRGLAEQFPKSNHGRSFTAQILRPDVGDVQNTLWLLLGAVSLLLAIACVNVASLLLARAVSRQQELAMRAALGAGRGRLVRQCLTESAVLGLSGGILGILIAALGTRPFIVFWPGSLPRAEEVQVDWRVLLFALAISLLCGLLFGLAPALRAPVRDFEQTLRAGARTVIGNSRRLHSGFVISEIALAGVLLVSAGMLGRTLLHLSSLNPGVNVKNVLTARMALSPPTLRNAAQIRAAWQDILENAQHVPGVQSAALVDTIPMREGNNQIGYWTTPVEPPENQQPLTLADCVTPDYFNVMGIRLLQGRFLTEQDRIGNESVAVIDEVMAQQAFGGDALGKRVWIGMDTDPLRVVGVVGHVRYWGPAGDDQNHVRAQLYYPFTQVPARYLRRWSELMSISVRTAIPPLNLLEPLRQRLRGATGDQVLYEVRTMEQIASATLARQRFLLLLFGVFAVLALLLASIGLYGVLAYLANQRIPEMGVRIALGASSAQVMWLIFGQSLRMILTGLTVGILAALGAGQALIRLVEGVRGVDASAFVLMIPILVGAALFASFLPARRASHVDPVQALRQE